MSKIKSGPKKTLLLNILIYLFFAFLIGLNFFDANIELAYIKNARFFDSDTLYLHQLFIDIFILKHNLLTWHLTPAPYFFPDMLVFFIIEIFVHHKVFLAIIFYAIFQYLMLMFLAQKFASVAFQGGRVTGLIYSILLLVLLFLVFPEIMPYYLAIMSVYHFGGFVNGLLLILFSINLIKNPKSIVNIIMLGVISALGVASDMLFLMQFFVPAILAWVVFFNYEDKGFKLVNKYILTLTIGVMVGVLIKHVITFNVLAEVMHISPLTYIKNFMLIIKIHQKNLSHHFIVESLSLTFYVVTLFQATSSIRKQNKNIIDYLRLIIVISSLCTIFGLAMFNVIPQWYMINIVFFPIVFCWLPFASISYHQYFFVAQYVLLAVIIMIATYVSITSKHTWRYEYYPAVVQCVDLWINHYNLTHDEKIKYGLASYWYARVISSLSKNDLQISPVTRLLHEVDWISNPGSFKRAYDFVVITYPSEVFSSYRTSEEFTIDENLIEEINKKPFTTFSCGNEATVLIYGKNKLALPHNFKEK